MTEEFDTRAMLVRATEYMLIPNRMTGTATLLVNPGHLTVELTAEELEANKDYPARRDFLSAKIRELLAKRDRAALIPADRHEARNFG